jgi:hypothetical protein
LEATVTILKLSLYVEYVIIWIISGDCVRCPGILDFLGGVGTAANTSPAATPAAGPHRYRQTVLPAHHPVTPQTAVHPTPPTTNPAADPYTQWRGILAPPTANFACSSCGGGSNHVGTWFNAVSHTRICKACQDPIRTVT